MKRKTILFVNFVQGLCALCGKKLTTEDTEEILHKGHKGEEGYK